jgi:DNA phosphorothioation-dependent restriction protein DptG
MMKIELNKEGVNGLKSRYLDKNNKFRGHYTGSQIKLLPFSTKLTGKAFDEDFKSFQGIIGELFRILNSKSLVELNKKNDSFKLDLKETILKAAIEKVDTEHLEEFKNMITKLFFDEDAGLVKFNIRTLSYMNFINSNIYIKEISRFLFDVFIPDDFGSNIFNEDVTSDNLLHQLIIDCLPNLSVSNSKSKGLSYHNLFPEIKEHFVKDFTYLSSNNSLLLRHVEDFFKYYYFHYLSQSILHFNNFGSGTKKVKPITFTMDWETLSESRLYSHSLGWKQLSKYSESVFSHVNAIELLNYIYNDNKIIGNYNNMVSTFEDLNFDNKEKFKNCIYEIISFYTESIELTTGSWDDCKNRLELDIITRNFDSIISKDIYSLWYTINYQFSNTKRENADSKYAYGFSQFCTSNYTKFRGRLGNTAVLSQEFLLFMTKICIGTEEKIRLKTLWDKFKERGIVFDETTKLEITKLFEKINLIEKKSDSGDAQYVKSTI